MISVSSWPAKRIASSVFPTAVGPVIMMAVLLFTLFERSEIILASDIFLTALIGVHAAITVVFPFFSKSFFAG